MSFHLREKITEMVKLDFAKDYNQKYVRKSVDEQSHFQVECFYSTKKRK
jgi:hypothetical protein